MNFRVYYTTVLSVLIFVLLEGCSGCPISPSFTMRDYIKYKCDSGMSLGVVVNIFGVKYEKVNFTMSYSKCYKDPDGRCSRSSGWSTNEKSVFFDRGNHNDLTGILWDYEFNNGSYTKESFLSSRVFIGLDVYPATSSSITLKDFIEKDCYNKVSIGEKFVLPEKEYSCKYTALASDSQKCPNGMIKVPETEFLTLKFQDSLSKCINNAIKGENANQHFISEDQEKEDILVRIDGKAPDVNSVTELLNIVPKKYLYIDFKSTYEEKLPEENPSDSQEE